MAVPVTATYIQVIRMEGQSIMKSVIFAVVLMAACSPALAGSGKLRADHSNTFYPTPSWVLPLPHSQRLANALGGFNRGYPADPYWDPCLSYTRSWGPGACGGPD